MNKMLGMMKKGSACIWVAPSGGRDRRDTTTNKIPLAPFDHKTIDMFRLLSLKSKVPTHFYPLAMSTYNILPPPDYVDESWNERRVVNYSPCGLKFAKEIANIGGMERRHLFDKEAEDSCKNAYEDLINAMYGLEKDTMMP